MKYFYLLIFSFLYNSIFSQVSDSCKISLGADLTVCTQSSPAIAFSTKLTKPTITWGGTIGSTCSNCPLYYPETKSAGVYFIYITASKGACVVSDTMKLTVLPQVATSAKFIKDTDACVNQKINLGDVSNNANYNYAWASVPTSVITNSNNPSVTLSKSISYYVTVTNGICPIPFLDTININVIQFNDLKLPKSDTIVCKGSTIQLCGVAPQAGATYKWSPATFVTDVTKLNTTFTPTNNVNYALEAKIGNCVANYSINLKVADLEITLAKSSNEITICKGESIVLALAKAKGIGTLSWFENGVKIANKDNIGSITLKPQVTTNVVASFRFGGCVVKDSILIKVIDNFKDVYFSSKDSVFCSDQVVNLKAIYPDGGFPDGTDLTWAVSNNTFTNVGDSISFVASNSGVISLTMKNGNCASQLNFPFVVKDLDDIKLTVPSNKICNGESIAVQLQNSNTNGKAQWYENDVKINNTASSYSFSPTQNTKIKVVYESGICRVSDSIVVEVFDNLKNTFVTLSDSVICKGKKINAVLKNKNGTFAANTNIGWDIPYNVFTTKIDSAFITADSTSIISVLVNNGVCKNTVSLPFVVKKAIDLTIVASKTNICQGDEVTIEALSNSNDKITWSLNMNDYKCLSSDCKKITTKPQKNTVIIATGTANQCMSSGGLSIKVNPYPIFKLPSKTLFCVGDKLDSLFLNEAPNPLYKYTWQSNDLGFQTSNLPAPKVKPSKTSTYTVKMENNGCVVQDSFKVIVANKGFLTITNDTTVCVGTNVLLSYKTDIQNFTAVWLGNINGTEATYNANPTKVRNSYSFTFSYPADGSVCTINDSVIVTGIAKPNLNLISNPVINALSPIEFGKNIELNAKVSNSSIGLIYSWKVNNQNISNKDSVYKFNIEKPTFVEVSVKNLAGCSVSSFIDFKDVDLPEILFPSVILPEGTEAENRNLRPFTKAKERREDIVVEYLYVYDRWGTRVYEGKDIGFSKDGKGDVDTGWNGKIGGKIDGEDAAGVFIYVASYKVGKEGKSTLIKGEVTVLR